MLAPSHVLGDGSQTGESYFWYALVDPDAVEAHLFRDGIEIPTQFEASWDLSECPEPANYQFSHKVKPFGHRHGPTEIDTTWWFPSERPDTDESIPGLECLVVVRNDDDHRVGQQRDLGTVVTPTTWSSGSK